MARAPSTPDRSRSRPLSTSRETDQAPMKSRSVALRQPAGGMTSERPRPHRPGSMETSQPAERTVARSPNAWIATADRAGDLCDETLCHKGTRVLSRPQIERGRRQVGAMRAAI
jgi:hypothetical protein